MTIHAEVVTMLATLNAAFPDVTSYEPSKLRALLRNRRAPLERLPDMRSVEDLAIDGPGGDLSIRVYRPHTSSDAIPLVVFAHGGGFVFCDLDSHDEFCRSMAQGVGALWSPSIIVWPLNIPHRQHTTTSLPQWNGQRSTRQSTAQTRARSCLPATAPAAILLRQLPSPPAIVEVRRLRRKFSSIP